MPIERISKKDFFVREYYKKNGNLEVEVPYVNGKVHGKKRFFFEDGSLNFEQEYVNGRLHGSWKQWRRDGSLEYVINFNNGERGARVDYAV